MTSAPGPGRLPARGARPVLAGNAMAAAAMLAWAAGFPAVDSLLTTWPPVALIVARLGMAGTGRKPPGPQSSPQAS